VGEQRLLADEANFVAEVALTVFAISLTFSMNLSYKELGVFPTLLWYQWGPRPRPRRHQLPLSRRRRFNKWGVATLISLVVNSVFLIYLGLFWCWLAKSVSGTPAGLGWFMVCLVLGAGVGLLPWSTYWFARHIVLDP